MPFAIGIENPKTMVNVGVLLRSAFNFGASCLIIVGERYKKDRSDTVKSYRHIPLMNFRSWEDYFANPIYKWDHIGVEITDGARCLSKFSHPRSAVYLLGPEDGSLDAYALERCKSVVSIPSRRCLNLAVAGSIVMYAREAEKLNKEPR